MTNNKEMVYDIIQDTMNVSKKEISEVKRTPGGETNESYFATVNNEKYVVRIPGKGTDELVNRRYEKVNLMFGTQLGINPELIYFDDETGVKITKKIPGAKAVTPKMVRESKLFEEVIQLFQRLHGSELPMQNRFDLFKRLDHYEAIAKRENQLQMDSLRTLTAEIHQLKEIYQTFSFTETPCHIDSVYVNILQNNEGRLFLIDWEYSGMSDPLWDLATLSLSLELNEEEELFFLTYYFGRTPIDAEMQRLHLLKIFLDYYWSLWYIYKAAQGEMYGNKGSERIKRAKTNIATYHMIYDEDVVV